MDSLFDGCSNILYLNLSNFDTSNVEKANNMFLNCKSLKYLNLENIKFSPTVSVNNIFQGLSPNVIYCIKDDYTKNKLLIPEKISFCSDECFKLNNTRIDISNEICLDSCLNSETNNYEYNDICLNRCPNGTLLYNYKCLDNECENNPNSNLIECLDGKPAGFYLDINDGIYKKCFENCKFCYGRK